MQAQASPDAPPRLSFVEPLPDHKCVGLARCTAPLLPLPAAHRAARRGSTLSTTTWPRMPASAAFSPSATGTHRFDVLCAAMLSVVSGTLLVVFCHCFQAYSCTNSPLDTRNNPVFECVLYFRAYCVLTGNTTFLGEFGREATTVHGQGLRRRAIPQKTKPRWARKGLGQPSCVPLGRPAQPIPRPVRGLLSLALSTRQPLLLFFQNHGPETPTNMRKPSSFMREHSERSKSVIGERHKRKATPKSLAVFRVQVQVGGQ